MSLMFRDHTGMSVKESAIEQGKNTRAVLWKWIDEMKNVVKLEVEASAGDMDINPP